MLEIIYAIGALVWLIVAIRFFFFVAPKPEGRDKIITTIVVVALFWPLWTIVAFYELAIKKGWIK